MTVEVVNDQNRVVVLDDGNIVVTQGGNTVEISDVGAQGPAGVGADGYVLQAYDSTDQVAASTTVAYPIRLGTVDISDGITVANNGSGQPTRITFANDGNYDVQFSIQFVNTSASEANVNVWFRKNETDLADSNSQVTVPKKHGSADGAIIMALNLIVVAGSGDYVEIIWQTDSTDVSIQHLPAGTTPDTPATPSVIVTATVVRYLEVGPAGPGVPVGGSSGQVLTKSSATDYDTAWATPSPNGTVLIKTQTVGTSVATVTITDCFSASWDSYIVAFAGIAISSNGTALKLVPLVGTTAPANGCYGNVFYIVNGAAGGLSNAPISNQNYMECANMTTTTANTATFTLDAPYRAEHTRLSFTGTDNNYWRFGSGVWRNTSQYTGFRFETFSGTLTGGTIRVYGYRRTA